MFNSRKQAKKTLKECSKQRKRTGDEHTKGNCSIARKKWSLPPKDSIKINFDAAIFSDQGATRFGVIVRDDKGCFKAAMLSALMGVLQPAVDEALAFREARLVHRE